MIWGHHQTGQLHVIEFLRNIVRSYKQAGQRVCDLICSILGIKTWLTPLIISEGRNCVTISAEFGGHLFEINMGALLRMISVDVLSYMWINRDSVIGYQAGSSARDAPNSWLWSTETLSIVTIRRDDATLGFKWNKKPIKIATGLEKHRGDVLENTTGNVQRFVWSSII